MLLALACFLLQESSVEQASGRPCRISPGIADPGSLVSQEGETLRERLEGFENHDGITHVFRDGAILLCLSDEAR